MGNSNHHLLRSDHILRQDLVRRVNNFGAPLIPVLLADTFKLLSHDLHDHRVICQHHFQPANTLHDLVILFDDFVTLKTGETLQTHIQDDLGLQFGELKALYQTHLGLGRIGRSLDQFNNLVQVGDSNLQPFQQMGLFLGLAQLKGSTAVDNRPAMVDKMNQDFLEI